MNSRIQHAGHVADWRLCLGCGACAYICPERKVRLIDYLEEGMRPVVEVDHCGTCSDCLQVCPGVENDHQELAQRAHILPELTPSFGPVLELWEGHATDPEIRHAGSSGGLITALSLFCLERKRMHGVLHIGMDPAQPTRNRTQLSRSRVELIANSGSRYSPAAACERLDLLERAPAPCVFVGQPSEVTALRKAQRLRPKLAANTGLALSFFCAGSPARKGTLELLRSKGINPADIGSLRYRGNGWPGMFSVTLKGKAEPVCQLTYRDSWSFMQAFRPFATHLCPDGTGEDADISCGDPWYREPCAGEEGSSLAVVRTEAGRQLLREAMETGYVTLQPAESWKLLRSQVNLVAKRGGIGGRVATLRLLGLPAPRLKGFALFKNWLGLSLGAQLRSTLGTVRRVLTRGYFRPNRVVISNDNG